MLRLHVWARLCVAWAFILGTEGLQCCPLTNAIVNLDTAMMGFDPYASNPLERPDPGVRSKIFEPFRERHDGGVDLNAFIDKAVESIHCETRFTEKSLHNYNQYTSEMSSSYSYSWGASVSASASFWIFSVEASAGFENKGNEGRKRIQNFFRETNGEIIQSTAKCITQVVAISPFYKPVFTDAFNAALQELHEAAKNPKSEASNAIFIRFVNAYGTHFMRKTQMGSKLIYQKLFTSKKLNTASEKSRQQCVSDSASASVGVGVGSLGSVSSEFSSASSRCSDSSENNAYFENNGLTSESVISIGSIPTKSLEDWASTVKDSPVPIHFELEKINVLFNSRWFDGSTASPEGGSPLEGLDWESMKQFFEVKINNYCESIRGEPCPPPEVGCGLNSDCAAGTVCIDDPDSSQGHECTVRYGGVIISGGYDGNHRVSNMEAIGTWQPPNLPVAVNAHTLSLVGSKIYNCGGFLTEINGGIDDCYVLDRTDSFPAWKPYIKLPKALYFQTATTLGEHIWMVHSNSLYDLNTNINTVRTYSLPFSVSRNHCAVSNNTHSYIIGAGIQSNEIWVNKHASRPGRWSLVARLLLGRIHHSCLWFENRVFITGGNGPISDTEVFNTDTHGIHKTGSLINGRYCHEMMLHDGEPAVVGGYDGKYLSSIETYDSNTNTWKVSSRQLQTGKDNMGLVQLRD